MSAMRRERYYVDTNVVIAIVEGSEQLSDTQFEFVARVDNGECEALTSELTLAECLAKPMADRNAALVETYLHFLDNRQNFPVVPVSRTTWIAAARLRGEQGIRLPDALHLASAVETGCSVFLTNDRRIRSNERMQVTVWDEL